jgi:hypothetical protein
MNKPMAEPHHNRIKKMTTFPSVNNSTKTKSRVMMTISNADAYTLLLMVPDKQSMITELLGLAA